MSSILEALKKAERESTPERGEATPWSAPLPEPSPYQRRKRRGWLPLGIVVIGCVLAAFVWQVSRHDSPQPDRSVSPSPPIRDNAPFPASKAPAAKLPLAQKKQVPPAAALQQAAGDTGASTAGSTVTAATAVPVEPAEKVLPATPPPAASQPHSPPLPKPHQKIAVRPAAPAQKAAPAETPKPSPVAAAEPPPQPVPVASPRPKERIKNYRSDQRIELQALVWAPEATARFVVINNRLIKEGGSIDNITVVRINRDDVLLSEGSDRWHEKFKIR